MRRLDPLTKTIHKFIMKEPDERSVLIELIVDPRSTIYVELDDYSFSKLGDDVLFDSIVRNDGESLFSLDFKFLDTISAEIRNNKTVIHKNNLSPNLIYLKISKLLKRNTIKSYSIINIYLCNTASLEITRVLEFGIDSFNGDKIVLLDEYDEECVINKGGILC